MTLIYKVVNGIPPIVQQVLDELGWVEFDESKNRDDEWNLLWKPTRPTLGEFQSGKSYQKFIHFPKTGILSTKDNLCRLMKKMKNIFGSIYNFTPTTFILPNEYKKFVEEFTKSDEKLIWICKPADLSRGRKIFLINEIGQLQYDQQSIIQKYIQNPLLIRGYKWDMRIYVLITKVRPLKVYLFREGIVRFSSEKYDTKTLGNVFSHLTNSSINKFAANVNIMSGSTFGSGIKWTFDQLRSYFRDQGLDYNKMWIKIETIIILTVINLASLCPDLDCCFELFGFDVMVDSALRPWLLEVNSCPAMSMDNNIDYMIKPDLIKDIINLVNFEPYDQFQDRQKKRQSMKQPVSTTNFFQKRTDNQKTPSVTKRFSSQVKTKTIMQIIDVNQAGLDDSLTSQKNPQSSHFPYDLRKSSTNTMQSSLAASIAKQYIKEEDTLSDSLDDDLDQSGKAETLTLNQGIIQPRLQLPKTKKSTRQYEEYLKKTRSTSQRPMVLYKKSANYSTATHSQTSTLTTNREKLISTREQNYNAASLTSSPVLSSVKRKPLDFSAFKLNFQNLNSQEQISELFYEENLIPVTVEINENYPGSFVKSSNKLKKSQYPSSLNSTQRTKDQLLNKRTKTACSNFASITRQREQEPKLIAIEEEYKEPPSIKQTPLVLSPVRTQTQPSKFVSREKSGKFELIFPFNKTVEDLSIALNRSGGSVSGPNYMKLLVTEIKKWEAEFLEYSKTVNRY